MGKQCLLKAVRTLTKKKKKEKELKKEEEKTSSLQKEATWRDYEEEAENDSQVIEATCEHEKKKKIFPKGEKLLGSIRPFVFVA